ncbi:uncharacterized protein N7484_001758 [Penicillium longicatenatum]|uniref:uncharacterized protein n=1 Tax=Penicillium longicatenatum TaxID=1561947 RepID=UPI002547554C|nr:uncharacterized protein N7484_001758 [Penicillium longicatenatum]KAJ5658109.1 hypothetical protein N7484_001758 [Penicillium longicatenatum]
MAIFDSDKRPRGLRVPSLTAMKNGSVAAKSQFSFSSKKSNEVKTPEEEPSVVPVAVPALPPQKAPPTKELPPPPKDQVPPPPRMLTKVPPRRKVANATDGITSPVAQTPVTAPAPVPAPVQAQAQLPSPPLQATPQAASPQTQVYAPAPQPAAPQPVRPAEQSVVVNKAQNYVSDPTVPPVTLSPPPSDENEALTPLEDFIPTPEGPGTPLDNLSTEELSMPPMPDIEPVAAPLNKIHFACFQEHRNMPVAQNVWCPLPCQTCHKFNREIRHRCVFCCLRVCEGCYQALQKCRNRSLSELMQKL